MVVCAGCGHGNAAGGKFCSECGASLAATAPPREQRKTVTVLFCDIAGSTALGESTDPEALRALLARYFERMKEVVERHGGSVEKFIGDAVMAVFGVPVLHEDDALRACRAAVEMREALPELGLRGRIGVNTGEVVAGTAERLATGDAVNVAARLEQAAEPGEVLIGAATLALVRDAADVGAERPLELKGKRRPVPAYPLHAVVGEAGFERRHDVPIVGRRREHDALVDAWQRALAEDACHLFTVLGAAGVGKSRLAGEFLSGLDGVRAVQGRCLSYGQGITYWPVVEMVSQLGERPADRRATEVLDALVTGTDGTGSAEEIAWAFRKLLEHSAPLVCVFDDLQWAEPTLLDLVEHVADWSREAPMLLLCMARPEFLDRRPGWAGGKLNASTVLLEPLSPAETDELIERLLGESPLGTDLRGRIRDAAEGNPLFVEEMLALAADSPGLEVTVPPTIQALLAARLDQLDVSERAVLERGAVEGKIFHRGSVEALAPSEPDTARRLMGLVRKELVRPDRSRLAGDDAFRFRHLLIRDAAYDGLPKAVRAELHERFADWLAGHDGDLVEADEICGYHLEQAHRYRIELGILDEHTSGLAVRAAARLGVAGERAFGRQDTAAIGLLERALELAPDSVRGVEWQLELIQAYVYAGRFARAVETADARIERARREGDRGTEVRVRLARAQVDQLGAHELREDVVSLVEEALRFFEETGDEHGLAEAWLARASIEHNACRFRMQHEALERAVAHARRTGDDRIEHMATMIDGSSYAFGPFPAAEGLAWFEAQAADERVFRTLQGRLEAMTGNFERARELCAWSRERVRDLGQLLLVAAVAMEEADVERFAGDDARCAEIALAGCAQLEELGERGWLSTLAGYAADALYRIGRDDEAWHWTDVAAENGAPHDVMTQTVLRQVRAKLLARRGEHAEAERLAREAVALSEPTDMLEAKADVQVDLAEVLAAAGRRDEAARALERAAELYREKGHLVGLARTESLLDALA